MYYILQSQSIIGVSGVASRVIGRMGQCEDICIYVYMDMYTMCSMCEYYYNLLHAWVIIVIKLYMSSKLTIILQ